MPEHITLGSTGQGPFYNNMSFRKENQGFDVYNLSQLDNNNRNSTYQPYDYNNSDEFSKRRANNRSIRDEVFGGRDSGYENHRDTRVSFNVDVDVDNNRRNTDYNIDYNHNNYVYEPNNRRGGRYPRNSSLKVSRANETNQSFYRGNRGNSLSMTRNNHNNSKLIFEEPDRFYRKTTSNYSMNKYVRDEPERDIGWAVHNDNYQEDNGIPVKYHYPKEKP